MKVVGKIKDSNGDEIIGANIFVSDSSGKLVNPPKGTSTDASGNYSLVINSGDYITATYVGTERQTVKPTGSNQDFKLTESKEAGLPEVLIEADRIYPKINYLGWIFLGVGVVTLITGIIFKVKGK